LRYSASGGRAEFACRASAHFLEAGELLKLYRHGDLDGAVRLETGLALTLAQTLSGRQAVEFISHRRAVEQVLQPVDPD